METHIFTCAGICQAHINAAFQAPVSFFLSGTTAIRTLWLEMNCNLRQYNYREQSCDRYSGVHEVSEMVPILGLWKTRVDSF